MTIEELFGTLQQSIVGAWRKHLRTSKYSKHMALDEFYTEMPEKVDALIEAWMGVNGRKPKSFDNLLSSKNLGTLDYLKSLRKVVKDGYELMNGEPEIEACLDDIVELIDSTLYKIKELKENKIMKNLNEFINEALNEGASIDQRTVDRFFGDIYNRPMSVKKYQMQSKQTLNNLKNEFSSEEYDMLYELAYNREGEYGRSYINMDNFDYKGIDFYAFSFDFHAINLPKSVTNALDKISTKYPMLVCDFNKGQFGIDHHIYGRISVDRFNTNNAGIETKTEFVKAVKEFLSIIKPFYDDIISYRDEDRDTDELRRRI